MATPERMRVQQTAPAVKKIEIIPSDPPTVDHEQLDVWAGDRVEWRSKSKDWVVAFDAKTPFELFCYHSSHPGTDPVPVSHGPKEEKFKYTIFVEGKSRDPIIIVHR